MMSIVNDPFLDQPTATIMLLGVFHFQDRGRDRHKPQHGFDVLSDRRQREVVDLVEQLAAFQATKIAIERTQDHQKQIDQDYQAYLRGEFQLSSDEIHQLGFRLGKGLGHQRIYCVNAWDRYYNPPLDCELYLQTHSFQETDALLAPHSPEQYACEHGQEQLLSQWWPRYQQQAKIWDAQMNQKSLREILLNANTEKNLLRSHGIYLVDRFKIGKGHQYPGPDWITAWYNRNLRIFANLQRITLLPDERILLIIGSGHVPILRHCVLASPEYALAEVHEYLTG